MLDTGTEAFVGVLDTETDAFVGVLGTGTEAFVGVIGTGTEAFVGVADCASAVVVELAPVAGSEVVVVVVPPNVGKVAILAAVAFPEGMVVLDDLLSLPHEATVNIRTTAIALLVRIFMMVYFLWSRGVPIA